MIKSYIIPVINFLNNSSLVIKSKVISCHAPRGAWLDIIFPYNAYFIDLLR
jgi:hypothetical protein